MALITAEARKELIAIHVAMFKAAPSADRLSAMVQQVEAGKTPFQVAAAAAADPDYGFGQVYPGLQTGSEFANSLADTLLASDTPAGARTWAVNWATTQLAAGVPRSDIIVAAVKALNINTNPDFDSAELKVRNMVDVAEYYSVTKLLNSNDLSVLRDVIASVTHVASTVTTAKAVIDGTAEDASGKEYVLTTSVDTFTGAAGNDTFIGQISAVTASNNTYSAVDTITGGGGTDSLVIVAHDYTTGDTLPAATVSGVEKIIIRAVDPTAADILNVSATNYSGATSFIFDRSTSATTITGLTSSQPVTIIGNASLTNGAVTANQGTFNFADGTRGGAVTQTGTGTATTFNSTGVANTTGAITLPATVTSLTVNAAAALQTGAITAAGLTTITASGAAAPTATNVGVTLGTLPAAVTTLNAGGLTAAGVNATLNALGTIVVTGGAGNDRITTGAALTTGSVSAGAGSADRLTIAADAHINTLALGDKYSGFEVVQIAAGGTQDLDLLATNNTINALRLAGTATVTNINAATAGSVTILADSTPSLGVKGALTPGQLDTVNITVTDESSTVNTITLTTPVLNGVETLGIVATDNTVVTALTSALALTNINVSGAGTASITTGAVALQTNFAVNAGSLTGNFTFNGTGATTNGFSVIGGSGTNTITGGNQIFSANISASTAKADVITVTNLTGGTVSLANAKITGFTNSADVLVGDKVDVLGTATVGAAIAATATTAVPTMTAAVSATGIVTFAGTGAAGATLTNKIDAVLEAAFIGGTNDRVVAFEHGGNTYLVESDGAAGFTAAADQIIEFVGLTGITALSTTASGAGTIWVI